MKQELIEFINNNLNDTNYLRTTEELVENTAGDNLLPSSTINRVWGTSKVRVLEILDTNYNDELQGNMPNDTQHIVKIKSWKLVLK